MIPRVRPGVFEVRASERRPARRLMRVDLPTFERPAIATSVAPTGGTDSTVRASATKTASATVGAKAGPRARGAERAFGRLSCDKRDRLASTAVTNGLRLIGLTGGIGSGKSTVARLLAERGIPVIDADEISREAVAPGSAALREIAAIWPDVVGAGEQLDRRALGRKIFSDPAARIELEGILHPRIIELSEARARALATAGHTLAFYEASLLVETGRYRELDGLVVVDAPEGERIARVVKRDDVSEADVRGRMAAQLPLADKLEVATFVIRNDGDLDRLRAQVGAMLSAIAPS